MNIRFCSIFRRVDAGKRIFIASLMKINCICWLSVAPKISTHPNQGCSVPMEIGPVRFVTTKQTICKIFYTGIFSILSHLQLMIRLIITLHPDHVLTIGKNGHPRDCITRVCSAHHHHLRHHHHQSITSSQATSCLCICICLLVGQFMNCQFMNCQFMN